MRQLLKALAILPFMSPVAGNAETPAAAPAAEDYLNLIDDLRAAAQPMGILDVSVLYTEDGLNKAVELIAEKVYGNLAGLPPEVAKRIILQLETLQGQRAIMARLSDPDKQVHLIAIATANEENLPLLRQSPADAENAASNWAHEFCHGLIGSFRQLRGAPNRQMLIETSADICKSVIFKSRFGLETALANAGGWHQLRRLHSLSRGDNYTYDITPEHHAAITGFIENDTAMVDLSSSASMEALRDNVTSFTLQHFRHAPIPELNSPGRQKIKHEFRDILYTSTGMTPGTISMVRASQEFPRIRTRLEAKYADHTGVLELIEATYNDMQAYACHTSQISHLPGSPERIEGPCR